jgi:hypothetical protein
MINQQQNEISLARVLASFLVGESQAWNFVKHRIGWINSSARTNLKQGY